MSTPIEQAFVPRLQEPARAAAAACACPDATPARCLPGVHGAALRARIDRACTRIAPLWPLEHFVAVNPFLGLSDQTFEQACATLQRVAGVGMVMPPGYYGEHLASGRIVDEDLRQAIAAQAAQPTPGAGSIDVAGLRRAALAGALPGLAAPPGEPTAAAVTVAQVLDRVHGTAWSRLAVEEIAKWCAARFDDVQAAWPLPHRDQPLYAAWRAVARVDRNPQAMGLAGFCAQVEGLPTAPVDAIRVVLDRLALPEDALDDYLHRALLDVSGWGGYLRHRAWSSALRGEADDSLAHLLAIRLAWDGALHALHPDAAFRQAWRAATAHAAAAAAAARRASAASPGERGAELLLLRAFEFGYQRDLLARLARLARTGRGARRQAPPDAPLGAVQAAFFIDVR